jgi:putative nucleotidyltransferase with HDIG domain
MQLEQPAWRRRPFAGAVLRTLIVIVPVVASVGVGLLVAAALPRPGAFWFRLAWSGAVMASSTLGLVVLGRLARRLLPLALLLRVGLVFPETAPRRFGVALRAVRPGRGEDTDDPAAALALLSALMTHDRRTRGHSERVAAYALLIAEELGLDAAARAEVRWAGLLHDVGKIDVPGAILNKPEGLDEDEWAVMAGHPGTGAVRVAALRPWLGNAVVAVHGHHERWDGTGYPNRVRAEDLPLSTRIVAVADAVETMTAARAYKAPMTMVEARAEVRACAGGQFDPVVVRAFLGVSVPRLWQVAGPVAWLAQVPLLGAVLPGSLVPGVAFAQAALAAVGQVAGVAVLVGTALTTSGVTVPPETAAASAAASTSPDTAPAFVVADGDQAWATGWERELEPWEWRRR